MNNKGQVLVLFVLLLPIIILIFALIINVFSLGVEKRNMNNTVYDAMEYYVKNKDDIDILDKVKDLIKENIKNSNVNITLNDEKIVFTVSKEYKGLANIIPKKDITITYEIIKDTNKIIKG